jgi:hypothetical protein
MASITELLGGLMDELTREQHGTTHPESIDYRELCRWEDEQHIYFEADLGTDLGSNVDICIHRGRAFIRMTRS